MLTRHGWSAVVLAVAMFASGRVFALVDLYVIGAATVAAVAASLAMAARQPSRMHVIRTVTPTVAPVGEQMRVDITVHNDGRRRAPRLTLWEPIADRGGVPMATGAVPPGRWVASSYLVPTDRRGVLEIGPMVGERTDPLGLSRRTFEIAGSTEVVVVPAHVPLALPDRYSGGSLGRHLRHRGLARSGSEFHSQRPYVTGDDLRRVDWKASARVDALIVREHRTEIMRRCTVVLDTADPAYDDASFERAVSAALSVVTSAEAAGVDTRLVAASLDLRGVGVAAAAQRHLASIRRGGSTIDLRRTVPATDGAGLVVIVCASANSAQYFAAAADETVVAIHCDDPGDAEPTTVSGTARFIVAAPTLDALRAGWARLVDGAAP